MHRTTTFLLFNFLIAVSLNSQNWYAGILFRERLYQSKQLDQGPYPENTIYTPESTLQFRIGYSKKMNDFSLAYGKCRLPCIFRIEGPPYFNPGEGFDDFAYIIQQRAFSFNYSHIHQKNRVGFGFHTGCTLGFFNKSVAIPSVDNKVINNVLYQLDHLEWTISELVDPSIYLNSGLTLNWKMTKQIQLLLETGYGFGILNSIYANLIRYSFTTPSFTEKVEGVAFTNGNHYYLSTGLKYSFFQKEKKQSIRK